MGGFHWFFDDLEESIEIVYSLCQDGEWITDPSTNSNIAVRFTYLDYEDLMIVFSDLEELDEGLGQDIQQQLLQSLNLEAT